MRAKLALWIMGATNRAALDDLMEVFCRTKRNYQTSPKGELIDTLTRRWYSSISPDLPSPKFNKTNKLGQI